MGTTLRRNYDQKVFEVGQIKNAFAEAADSLGLSSLSYSIHTGGGELSHRNDTELSELVSITEVAGNPSAVGFTFGFADGVDSTMRGITLLSGTSSYLEIHVEAGDAELVTRMVSLLEADLQLERSQRTDPWEERISRLEATVASLAARLPTPEREQTCFLSYRFSQRVQALALKLTRFLDLLGVKVVSGAGYEPRGVAEKVRARLAGEVDFFVYLIASDGESAWTRDELGLAMSQDHPVVLIVQEGQEVGKGLLADHEYLSFAEDQIEASFLGILEAVRYVQNVRGDFTSPTPSLDGAGSGSPAQ